MSALAQVDRVVYGLLQPLRGARRLLGDPPLLRIAMVPALWLAGVCFLGAALSAKEGHLVRRFYELFAMLAPLPSIFLTPYYARLAVQVHERLGLGPSRPCL